MRSFTAACVMLFVDCETEAHYAASRTAGAKFASPDYGRPFSEIFAGYNNDFYRIDPMLFSPAVISSSTNRRTGTIII